MLDNSDLRSFIIETKGKRKGWEKREREEGRKGVETRLSTYIPRLRSVLSRRVLVLENRSTNQLPPPRVREREDSSRENRGSGRRREIVLSTRLQSARLGSVKLRERAGEIARVFRTIHLRVSHVCSSRSDVLTSVRRREGDISSCLFRGRANEEKRGESASM